MGSTTCDATQPPLHRKLPEQTAALRVEALQRACATSTAVSFTSDIIGRAEKFLQFLETGAADG